MTKLEIHNEVQEIFRDVFDEEDIVITDETNADDIDEWDSLSQIRLTVSIEKKFGIKFDFGELTSLHNVGEMIDLIEKKITD